MIYLYHLCPVRHLSARYLFHCDLGHSSSVWVNYRGPHQQTEEKPERRLCTKKRRAGYISLASWDPSTYAAKCSFYHIVGTNAHKRGGWGGLWHMQSFVGV